MSKKIKKDKSGPKTVQPMNKKTKNIIIWTTTGVVVAGITAGITVPLVLASQKKTYLNAFKDYDKIKGNELLSGLSFEEIQQLLDNAGLADVSLLNEITYQSSFYLYNKEQKGSLNLQMMNFQWDIYSAADRTGAGFDGSESDQMTDKELLDARTEDLSEINKVRKQIVQNFPKTVDDKNNLTGADGADTYLDPIYASWTQPNYVDPTSHKFINLDSKEGREPNKNDAKYQAASGASQADKDALNAQYNADLQKYKDLNAQLKTKKELVNKTIDKMDKLGITIKNVATESTADDLNGGLDYKSSTFATDYPVVLLPIDNIREKQQKVFNDMKSAVVSSYNTREEGLTEWAKQMPQKFDGATKEEQAVDSLVHKQVSSTAFARFDMAINSDYTVKQYKSNIFSDILGEYDRTGGTITDISGTDVEHAKEFGVAVEAGAKDSDKVYFFGTKSKDPHVINALMETQYEKDAQGNPTSTAIPGTGEMRSYINRINGGLNLISINNAIFPIKQGTTYDAPWTITKDDITKMFQFMGTDKQLPIAQWGQIFTRPDAEALKLILNNPSNTTAKTVYDAYKAAESGFITKRNLAMDDEITKAFIEAETRFKTLSSTEQDLFEVAFKNANTALDADSTAKGLWAAYSKAKQDLEKNVTGSSQTIVDAALAAVKGNPVAEAYRVAYENASKNVAVKAYMDAWIVINDSTHVSSLTLYTQFDTARNTYNTARAAAIADTTPISASDARFLVKTIIELEEQDGTDPIDKEIIGRASGTTDGTRWKSGDLGLMTSLNYIKGMTNGWAAGVTAILSGDENAIYQPGFNVLQGLTDTIIITFNNLAVDKARLGLTTRVTQGGDISSLHTEAQKAIGAMNDQIHGNSTANPVIAANQFWNQDVKDFVTSLTDEEIAKTFGAAIRDYFRNLPAEGTNPGTTDPLHHISGYPVAIEIEKLDMSSNADKSGVYMTITEEFGIHVMKINRGTNSLIDRMMDDLATAAEEQATTKITTDYAKILTEKLTLARKVEMIMFDEVWNDANNDGVKDPSEVTRTADEDFRDYLMGEQPAPGAPEDDPKNHDGKIHLDLDGDKIDDTDQEIWDKAEQLIIAITQSEDITTVNAIPAGTLSTWLSGRIDSRLSGNPLIDTGSAMRPEDIYNDLQRIGGI